MNEAEQFLDFIKSLNIDTRSVLFSRLLWYYPEIEELYTEVPPELTERLVIKGQSLGISSMCNLHNKPTIPANECTAWLMPYIFPDGDVISCCCMNEQNRRDWQKQTKLGNIFEKSFREIWYDKPYVTLRHKLHERDIKGAHPCCEICNIMDTKHLSNI